MSKFEKSMTEIFDVMPIEEPKKENLPAERPIESETTLDRDLDKDYKEARETLRDLVEKGNLAIDSLLSIASESEHPRAFEVVATLIKNTAEVNEKLLNAHKSVREMKGMKNSDNKGSGVNVDKAIFVGSTAELSKLLKNERNDDK
jgi:hypothetical protein